MSVGKPCLPTRLIYLDSSRDSALSNPVGTNLHPRLVSTKGMEFSESRYIALSYRWPEDFPNEAKSTRDTVRDQMRGLDVSKLPRNFNDVFQVATTVGISYVWIDSLCIIQDNPEDWNRESALMSQIYRNAYFTVAVAVPPTVPDLGFFRRGDPSDILSERLVCPLEDGSSEEIVLMKTQSVSYCESPLNDRGWCFQEREISRRILHYTETQVLWECRTLRASEGLPNGVDPSIVGWPERMLDNDLSGEEFSYAWHRAVEDYSSRHLTKATDKLPALAGLAAAMRDYKSATCRYLAGLWEDDFLPSLAWCVYVTPDGRYSDYIAPTWSWVSVRGPVSYHVVGREPQSSESSQSGSSSSCDASTEQDTNAAKCGLQVLDILVETCTTDPLGAVRHAVLKCNAGLVPAVLPQSRDRPHRGFFGEMIVLKTASGGEVGAMRFDFQQEEYDQDDEDVKVVFCIYLGGQCWSGDSDPGLVVLPTGNRENEYRRVGIIRKMLTSCLSTAQFKEITII